MTTLKSIHDETTTTENLVELSNRYIREIFFHFNASTFTVSSNGAGGGGSQTKQNKLGEYNF